LDSKDIDAMTMGGHARVLVVDDDVVMARLVVDALRRAGHSAAAVRDADEAICAISTAPPDIAILDIRMPGMSGLDLSAILRDRFALPFIFITAADDEATVRRATELGALAYLVKPIEATQYGPAVEAALARARDLRTANAMASSLEQALAENRAVGVTVGLLMERLRVDRITAFEYLRDDARSRRRRISDVAEELLNAAELINGVLSESKRAATLPAS
jgi:response regulator NasT